MNGEADLAIYLPSLRGGGAERVIVTLANALIDWGYRVDLVLACAEGPYLQELASDVRIVDLRSSRMLLSASGLFRYLRREKPAVLLSAMRHANVVAILVHAVARSGTRLVVSERNHASLALATLGSWKRMILGSLMGWAYPRADTVVAVSEGVAADIVSLLGLPESKIEVIYSPVVTSDLIRKSHAALDDAWFRPGEPSVILAVGRLDAQKDFCTLVDAFARVRQSKDVRLVILGEGEGRSALEDRARELGVDQWVKMPGFVDNPFAYMRRATVYVLSSRWEGLPNALIQAMACGAPVVSTDCPSGPREILENGRWGRLVPVGDPDLMAEAIVATLGEQQHPDVTARAADFGLDNAVDAYARVLFPSDGDARTGPEPRTQP